VIFLPALDWLIVGGMIFAAFFVVLIALLVHPPTALVDKLQEKERKKED
jgi:hypothetical protein